MSRVPGEKATARAEAQRERILDAAQQCFIADGFHAATMATIAQRADISAGLIYRYFESKDAIVLAIIERQLQLSRAKIAALHGSVDIATGFAEAFRDLRAGPPGGLSAALYLEMSAEATRDGKVAAALEHADTVIRDDLRAWLARPASEGGRGLARDRAEANAMLMQVMFQGLAVLSARDPHVDPTQLRRAIGVAVDRLS